MTTTKTPLLLVAVLELQDCFMVAACGSHMFGLPASRYLGLAIWVVLPTGVAGAACFRLLIKSAGMRASRQRDALIVGMSVALPVLALDAGMFVSVNAFGEWGAAGFADERERSPAGHEPSFPKVGFGEVRIWKCHAPSTGSSAWCSSPGSSPPIC